MWNANVSEAGPIDRGEIRLSLSGPAAAVEILGAVPPEHLYRSLLGAYLSGIDCISIRQPPRLTVETDQVLRAFRARVCPGARIGGSGAERELSRFDEDPGASLAEEALSLSEAVLRLIDDALAPGPWGESLVIGWEARDDPIDRLAWKIHRQVMRRDAGPPSPGVPSEGRMDRVGWLEASRILERMGDHAARIGRLRSEGPPPTCDRARLGLVDDFGRHVRAYAGTAVGMLRRPVGLREAHEGIDLGEALELTATALFDRLAADEGGLDRTAPWGLVRLGRILDSEARIVAYTRDLIEVALDHGRPVEETDRPHPAPREPGPLGSPPRRPVGGTVLPPAGSCLSTLGSDDGGTRDHA
ncbi:MAG: PhoU domain-containing protein [Thermoplasmata archaeon]